MLRRLYDWTMALAAHPRALLILFIVSFAESSVFPIPPDVLLIPMVLAARGKWIWIAAVCTVSSVLGGWLGYAIGAVFYQQVGAPVLEVYGMTGKFEELRETFTDVGAGAVFFAALSPVPYKVFTILSGVMSLDLTTFTGASLFGRGIRYFLIAWLLYMFGEPIRRFIEQRLGLMFILFCVLLAGGFVFLKFLH
ncbi:MAG: YqaA family protein [Rhodospirillales bacterium]